MGEADAERSDYFGLGPGNYAVGRPSFLNIDLINFFGRLGPEATHFVLRGGADVQRIDRSSAGRDATKDDPFWLRCRGRRMYEDRRICGARFGYSLASRQEVEDGGESASSFKTYRGRPPRLAASFISNVACWRAQSRHARRRCRCPLSGATLTDRSHQAAADCGFFPAPRARNFLGYRREFLPAPPAAAFGA